MKYDAYKTYWVRPGTMDKYVINELKGYQRLPLGKSDVVLDIGANIGSYAQWAGEQCKSVTAVEPEPENYALLKRNIGHNVRPMNCAVVGDSYQGATIPLWTSPGPNKGSHSTVPTRGREPVPVTVVRMGALLKLCSFTVLKMDCEGAEYDLLLGRALPKRLQAVLIEYHLQKKGQWEAANLLDVELQEQGFRWLKPPKLDNEKLWHTTAIYVRGER